MTDRVITLKSFFEQARGGTLTGIRCGHCGELAIPPKEFCSSCHQRAWQPVTLSGDGTVVSYTIIRVAPRAHADDAPYAVAMVALREGVSLLGRLVDIPVDKVEVGLRVRFRPLMTRGQTSLAFGPA